VALAKVTRVLHLVGSAVDDFHADLSRLYAGGCLDALADCAGYDAHIAYVSPGGSWRFPAALNARALAQAPVRTITEALQHILSLDIDVVVPQMFCLPGMTDYRALLDVLGIAYLGNRPEVMSLGAAKPKARAVVAAAGVAVPTGEVLARGQRCTLPLPVVVKPVDADNSVGVSLARDPAEVDTAIESASAHSDAVLVESYVELGREVRCGIVVRDGELMCLPLEEYAVDPDTKPIRTGEDKIARTDQGAMYLVAKDDRKAWIVRDDAVLTERVWAAARRAHHALGCRHYSLFDFRIDPGGRPWFLEAGLYCSYAPSSVIPTMAAAAGLDVTDLFEIGLSELQRERTGCLTSPR
jgi:D-alanine-D-alanine ligase